MVDEIDLLNFKNCLYRLKISYCKAFFSLLHLYGKWTHSTTETLNIKREGLFISSLP